MFPSKPWKQETGQAGQIQGSYTNVTVAGKFWERLRRCGVRVGQIQDETDSHIFVRPLTPKQQQKVV